VTGRAQPGLSHAALYMLVALMTTLWSLNYIAAKIALRELPPLFVAGLRTALAGMFILPVYLFRRRSVANDWTASDVPILLALGIFGVALNQLFFVLGIGRTSVAHAGIMIALSPIMVLLLAVATGLEKLSRGRLGGMLLALGGVAVVQMNSAKSSRASSVGDILVLLGALTFAMFTIRSKQLSSNFTSVTLNTFAYTAGGAALLPMTIWQARFVPVGRVSIVAWISVLYMAIVASVICYLIYYYALTHIPASRVSAFSYLQPVLATSMAVPLLGEQLSISVIGGGVLVLIGVMIAERM
jgi:drug/metabolite transporter (DMT)-like permease